MRNKIAFYGAGNVGATAAHWLAEREVGDCVLFDIFGQVAAGKALDLFQSGPPIGFDTQVLGSNDPGIIEGADIVVVTAGIPRKKDPVTGKFPSRDELVKTNQEVMTEVSENIKQYAPDSIVIVVTNPLDAMCHVVKHVTGFRANGSSARPGPWIRPATRPSSPWSWASAWRTCTASSWAGTATPWCPCPATLQ
jgi:malate dehydrogenase